MSEPTDLPIFELPLVLLPSERLPLHIFEERYKAMISDCLDTDEPFGIVLRTEDGPAEVGCTARVEEVLDRYEDGRLNILVVGEQPFRVVRRFEADRYPAGDVEALEDDEATGPEAAAEAQEAFATLMEMATGERPDDEELAELDAYQMAARVELDDATKQALLETRSERERLSLVESTFRDLGERIGEAQVRHERASGNGKVSRL